MKKIKLFEVSLINKAYSRVVRDTTRFYTSDTALEIGFKLAEAEYSFDSGVILLLNEDDRSIVVRDLVREGAGFIYTLENDIIEHYGNWAAQLKFEKDGETYVSSPVGFSIHNDLYNSRPPKLSEVNTWKNLRKIADRLIDDLREELEALEVQELAMATAESERQSAEDIRIANENQRNLTSVEEFAKLQDAIGGRNLLLNSDFDTISNWNTINHTFEIDNGVVRMTATGNAPVTSRLETTLLVQNSGEYIISARAKSTSRLAFKTFNNAFVNNPTWVDTKNEWTVFSQQLTVHENNTNVTVRLYLEKADAGTITEVDWMKLEKGSESTPYTKAPEDYTSVSKDDYYNHIKLMNDFKDSQTELALDMSGKVKIVNLVQNGNFADGLTGISPINSTRDKLSIENGILRVDSTTNAQDLGFYINVDRLFKGHKIYTTVDLNLNSSLPQIVYVRAASPKIENLVTEKAITGKMSGIITTSADLITFYVTVNGAKSGDPYYYHVKSIQMIDLTSIFGEGNEPSKGAMDWVINKSGYFDELSLKRDDLQQYEINQLRNAVIALGGTI